MNNTTTLNKDQYLINEIINKNKIAFAELYDKYANSLFGIIQSIINDQKLSEDILQISFCHVWNSASEFDASKQRLFTWMLQIARAQARKSVNLRYNAIQGQNNYVSKEEKDKFEGYDSTNLLELILLKGLTLQEASHSSGFGNEELKTRLRSECSFIRD